MPGHVIPTLSGRPCATATVALRNESHARFCPSVLASTELLKCLAKPCHLASSLL